MTSGPPQFERMMAWYSDYCRENPEEVAKDQDRTRWHEGGHALAAFLEFGGISYVTVQPEAAWMTNGKPGTRLGYVEYLASSRVNHTTIEKWAAVRMAGPMAEILAGVAKKEVGNRLANEVEGVRELHGFEDDEDRLKDDAVQVGLGTDDKVAFDLIARGRCAAKELLEKHFPALQAVVKKLETKKRLSGEEVRRCIALLRE